LIQQTSGPCWPLTVHGEMKQFMKALAFAAAIRRCLLWTGSDDRNGSAHKSASVLTNAYGVRLPPVRFGVSSEVRPRQIHLAIVDGVGDVFVVEDPEPFMRSAQPGPQCFHDRAKLKVAPHAATEASPVVNERRNFYCFDLQVREIVVALIAQTPIADRRDDPQIMQDAVHVREATRFRFRERRHHVRARHFFVAPSVTDGLPRIICELVAHSVSHLPAILSVVRHHDARKALHDPNPPPRPAPPPARSVTLDVERMAARVASALRRHPRGPWSVLERVCVDRLLDHLEEQHEPAEVDAAVDRFVEMLHVRLAGGSGAG
jgi:hypothetical protein